MDYKLAEQGLSDRSCVKSFLHVYISLSTLLYYTLFTMLGLGPS
jgi:hypothetical protein